MATKICVSKELSVQISQLYSDGYHTGQIANMLHIPEFKVVDVLQRDAAQRHIERSKNYVKAGTTS